MNTLECSIIFRQTDEVDEDVGYDRIHPRECNSSSGRHICMTAAPSDAPVRKAPSQDCRCCPSFIGNTTTTTTTCCNRLSSVDQTCVPDIVYQCLERRHQLPSKRTNNTSNQYRPNRLEPTGYSTSQTDGVVNPRLPRPSDVIAATKRLPGLDVEDAEFRQTRRRLVTSQPDEDCGRSSLKMTTIFREKRLPALRRQDRFVGEQFHAERSAGMTLRWTNAGDNEEIRRRRNRRRRVSLDRTRSSTTTYSEINSCLDRGFLVDDNASATAEDSGVSDGMEAYDRPRFRRQRCVWNPDISPIRSNPSTAIDRLSGEFVSVVPVPDSPPDTEKSTEFAEKVDRRAGKSRCDDVDARSMARDGDMGPHKIDENTVPSQSVAHHSSAKEVSEEM